MTDMAKKYHDIDVQLSSVTFGTASWRQRNLNRGISLPIHWRVTQQSTTYFCMRLKQIFWVFIAAKKWIITNWSIFAIFTEQTCPNYDGQTDRRYC